MVCRGGSTFISSFLPVTTTALSGPAFWFIYTLLQALLPGAGSNTCCVSQSSSSSHSGSSDWGEPETDTGGTSAYSLLKQWWARWNSGAPGKISAKIWGEMSKTVRQGQKNENGSWQWLAGEVGGGRKAFMNSLCVWMRPWGALTCSFLVKSLTFSCVDVFSPVGKACPLLRCWRVHTNSPFFHASHTTILL